MAQNGKKVTVDYLVEQYIVGGKDSVAQAQKENSVSAADNLTLNDLKMDSLDVVQLAVKIQDDLGIQLSDDEFTKVPQGDNTFKPADKVTLGDIVNIINAKV